MQHSMRWLGGLVDLFCVRVNEARETHASCEHLACSGAERDLASGEEGRAGATDRDPARLVRQWREQYGDLDVPGDIGLRDIGPSTRVDLH
ncbi:MAG: hypothetical protein FJ294_11230 [Planctomycetes bacterium]|nr:hypothetical protein [Planctomycetota bacterium]